MGGVRDPHAAKCTWMEDEKRVVHEEEHEGPFGTVGAIQAHNAECWKLIREQMYVLMERERCAMEKEDKEESVKRRRLY